VIGAESDAGSGVGDADGVGVIEDVGPGVGEGEEVRVGVGDGSGIVGKGSGVEVGTVVPGAALTVINSDLTWLTVTVKFRTRSTTS